MLLRRAVAAAAGAFVCCAPASGRADLVADIIGYPLKAVFGSTLDKARDNANAVIKNGSALVGNVNTVVGNANALVNNASGQLSLHEQRISELIGQVDHTLEVRVLDIKTQASALVDDSLRQVKGVGEDLLAAAGKTGARLIEQADGAVSERLKQVDTILHQNSADINAMLEQRTSQIDQAVADRIAQADEAVGRRLGDLDVIASEQRLALERTVLRAAVLIGLVAFVVFVLRNLWLRFSELERAEIEQHRGARRTGFLLLKLAPALVTPALAALCGVALLAALYRWLPGDAVREADELVALHQRQLADSVARIDYARARLEASHLGYLDPERAARYTGLVEKTALIRDVSARPALLSSQAGVADFSQRLAISERLLGPRPDPDLLTLRALLDWKLGATRRAEHRAASLAARALQLAPRGFALAPLARAYVATFLQQPYLTPGAGENRDAASQGELEDALAVAAPVAADSPFAGLVELASRMRLLEAQSTQAYVALAEANALAIAADVAGKAAERREQLQLRSQRAAEVVKAWQDFDRDLQRSERSWQGELLNLFELNDAVLTRALWYERHPEALARRGTPLLRAGAALERVQLAPARIAWTRRYGDLVGERLRPIFEAEEAAQFQTWERWSIELEDALIAVEESRAAKRDPAPNLWRATVAAAALGLYVERSQQRVPYAGVLSGGKLTQAPPVSSVSTKPAASKKAPAPLPTITGAPATLEELLDTRGPRLI
jgi:hypothetical protein